MNHESIQQYDHQSSAGTARILEADEVDRSGVAVDPTRPASVHFWTGATSDHFSLLQSTSVTYLAMQVEGKRQLELTVLGDPC
jgi:hypothetical protein